MTCLLSSPKCARRYNGPPVNYNTQFLIRTDKCILIETPPGDEFRRRRKRIKQKIKGGSEKQ